jgi:hypothetical protein
LNEVPPTNNPSNFPVEDAAANALNGKCAADTLDGQPNVPGLLPNQSRSTVPPTTISKLEPLKNRQKLPPAIHIALMNKPNPRKETIRLLIDIVY